MPAQLMRISGEDFVEKILQGERDFSRISYFSGISLESDFDLSGYEGFAEMQAYLKKQNLRKNPVIIEDSEFFDIKANGLYLPFVRGSRANFRGADLQGANLQRADLQGANLQRANLEGAYLRGANLGRSYLQGAVFQGADLQGAVFREAILTGAGLRGANLQEADLQKADLQRVYFQKADLQRADLREANLQGAKLREANLQGAQFDGVNLREADLREADLRGARGLENALNLKLAIYQNTRVTQDQEAIIRRALPKKKLFVVGDL